MIQKIKQTVKNLAILSAAACFLPAVANAQQITPEQMGKVQQMMSHPDFQKRIQTLSADDISSMMELTNCLQTGIGTEGLEKMNRDGNALNAKIRDLCAAGKQAEAETLAKDYARNMMQSREYKIIKSCAATHESAFNNPSLASIRGQVQQIERDPNSIKLCQGKKNIAN